MTVTTSARDVSRRNFLLTVAAAGGLYYLKDKITTPDVLTAQFEFATCPLTWRSWPGIVRPAGRSTSAAARAAT